MKETLALIVLCGNALTIIGLIVWRIWSGGRGFGSKEAAFELKLQHLTEDNQELHKAISVCNTLRESNYRELRNLIDRLFERRERT